MAAGMDTDFFTVNKSPQVKSAPLLFYETKTMMINDRKAGSVRIYTYEGKQLYRLADWMKAMGYQLKTKGSHILQFKKRDASYEFYLDSKFFRYNNEQYGVFAAPVISLDGKPYMEEKMVTSIFGITIEEAGSELRIKTRNP